MSRLDHYGSLLSRFPLRRVVFPPDSARSFSSANRLAVVAAAGDNTPMSDFLDQRRDVLARHLRNHIAGEVRFDEAARKLYSTDASIYRIEPLGVVLPRSVEDLVAVVQVAAEARVPLVPRGGGTSLSGQSIGPGLVFDCSKYLRHLLDLDPVNRTVRVQPGVVLDDLNRAP